MNMVCREITEKDIPASADIIRRAFKTVADEFSLTRENNPTHGAFIKDEKLFEDYRKDIKMFGLFEEEVQIGFAALESKDGEIFYLEKLAVLPEYRHKGGGRALMDFAVDYAREAGGKEISIGIIYENKRLSEWYRKYGFTETGTKIFPHLPFTVCFMKFDLNGLPC